jgi:hypothetical protein
MCTKHDVKVVLVPVALLMVVALLLPACGGDDEQPAAPPFPAAGEAGNEKETPKALKEKIKRKKKRAGEVDVKEFVAKPEWDALAPHFAKFGETLEDEIHNQSVTWKYKDAFADRTEKFYPPEETPKGPMLDLSKAKGVSPEKKKEERTIESILAGIVPPEDGKNNEAASEITDLGPKGPLETYPLDEYVFKIIMTGVSNPEALVEDPSGITHVVRLNDKIGSEGGHVVDIFKHKVFVRVPDQTEPIEVSLAPAMLPGSFAGQ